MQSRDGSYVADDWDDYPHIVEEIQTLLEKTKEAALKREKSLAHAFSHQVFLSTIFLKFLCSFLL